MRKLRLLRRESPKQRSARLKRLLSLMMGVIAQRRERAGRIDPELLDEYES